MNDKLRAALDQALINEVNVLFRTLISGSIINTEDAAIIRFKQGLDLILICYGRACLAIDELAPKEV